MKMNPIAGWGVVIMFFATLVGVFFLLKAVTSGSPEFSIGTTTLPTASAMRAEIPKRWKEYRSEKFGFSVLYPEEFSPREFEDHGPELTVLFQGGEGQPGFQIYVAPIEGNEISEERFMRDAPSGVRRDPENTAVAGVQAVQFEGFDAKVGQTHEVWMIGTKAGREVPSFLYEVSTYRELREDLDTILSTWRFL